MKGHHVAFASLVVLVFAGSTSLLRGASIVIVNKDPGGVGFNDPTAAAPVGGNSGTTLGQQRQNVFQAAASIWGAKLSSAITIKIAASFGALTPCDTSSGVLGSAGPTTYYGNFTNAPRTWTWYPVALASALSGTDLAAGLTDGASIQAQFNSNIGTAGCLPTLNWYLGLDGAHGSNLDLETVLLHEFGHGLGFIGVVSLSDGSFTLPGGYPDIFSYMTYDNSLFMHWNAMSNAQRLASITNVGYVVFDGSNTTAGASILSAGKDGTGHPLLYTPSPAEAGSSIYHFDKSATPNLLMEPVINSNLTHNVDLPNDLTMKAMLDFGWQPGCTLGVPGGVVATATTATSVGVSWTAATCAATYDVYRSSNHTTYTKVGSSATTSFSDTTASASTAYFYAVKAIDASSNASALSSSDLATTVTYTNDPLVFRSTTIKAVHLSELRTAVTAVSALAGVTPPSYTGTAASGLVIRAVQITELRTALDTAMGAISLTTGGYANSVSTGATVTATDFQELRTRMK